MLILFKFQKCYLSGQMLRTFGAEWRVCGNVCNSSFEGLKFLQEKNYVFINDSVTWNNEKKELYVSMKNILKCM